MGTSSSTRLQQSISHKKGYQPTKTTPSELELEGGNVFGAESTWRVEGLSIPVKGRWRVGVEILIDDFEKVSMDEEVELLR